MGAPRGERGWHRKSGVGSALVWKRRGGSRGNPRAAGLSLLASRARVEKERTRLRRELTEELSNLKRPIMCRKLRNGSIRLVSGCLLTFGSMTVVIVLLSATVSAQIPVFIEDDFNHDLGGFLNGSTTSDGNAVWSSAPSLVISFSEKAEHSDVANNGYVPFQSPTTSAFSIEAITSERDHCIVSGFGCNFNIGLGFSDDSPGPHPGGNIFGLSSLTLGIDHGGGIALWDNRFGAVVASGRTLADLDVGLTNDFQGDIPMLLELDPVNNTARAEVNNVEVYNIPYTIASVINWGGFGWSSTISGKWDDFKIRAQGPADPTIFEWNVDFSGAWNSTSAGSWQLGAVPNSDEATAIFGDKITTTRLILTDEDVTAKKIQFDSSNSYVLSGAGTVNLDSIDGLGQIIVEGGASSGDHQFQAVVKLHDEATATVNVGSSLTFDNELDLNGFTLTVVGGGSVVFNNQITGPGSVNCGGNCTGNATIAGNVENSGNLIAAALSITGDYTQDSTGSLIVELDESGDGGSLTVSGDAVLAGTLEVALVDGFQPALDDQFDILNLNSMSGTFDDIQLPTLSAGLAWDDSGLYTVGLLSVVPEPATFALFALGIVALSIFRQRRELSSTLVTGFAVMLVTFLSNTVSAQTNIVIADNFNRVNQLLDMTNSPVGGAQWDATYTVVNNQAKGLVQDHAFVPFTPPTDTTFSVEATTFRDLNSPTPSQVLGVGFSDIFFGSPPPGLGSASALSLTINPAGDIEMWDNAINVPQVASGMTLANVNLPTSEQGPIDLFLQIDPVNNRAVAEVNGIQVYDVAYTIPEQITWVGMFNGGMDTATFDEFAVRVGAPPASPTSFEWSDDHTGFWQTQSHWEPKGVPNANTDTAVFGASNLVPRSVSVDTSDVTVKSIQFDSPNDYVISGLGRVILEADSGGASITVDQGTHEFQAPVRLNSDTTLTLLSGATLEFDNRLNLNGNTLTIDGAGTVLINSNNITGNVAGTIQLDGGSVGGSGTVLGNIVNNGTFAIGDSPLIGSLTVIVPEPASWSLLVLAIGALFMARRSNGSRKMT
jgi:hypothetical protein